MLGLTFFGRASKLSSKSKTLMVFVETSIVNEWPYSLGSISSGIDRRPLLRSRYGDGLGGGLGPKGP